MLPDTIEKHHPRLVVIGESDETLPDTNQKIRRMWTKPGEMTLEKQYEMLTWALKCVTDRLNHRDKHENG